MSTASERSVTQEADLGAPQEVSLRSHVTEIIGGVGPRAPRGPEEPGKEEVEEEEEEEGDDSVFYDDEDRAPRPAEEQVSPRVGNARKRREERLVESEGAGAPGPEEMDSVASSAQETQRDVVRRPPDEHQESQHSPATEDLQNPIGGFPEDRNTLKTFPELRSSSMRKGEEEEEEEEEEVSSRQQRREPHAAELEPGGSVSEEGHAAKLGGEKDLPHQMSTDELQTSRENPKEPNQLEQQDHNSQGSTGRPQEPNPGYSTLPLPKKLGRGVGPKQDPSDHQASPRYNTLSYRKIQRGNTRQKIKEFEFMVMNL
ncbi:unnamed protein product [Merluccius merluccius]